MLNLTAFTTVDFDDSSMFEMLNTKFAEDWIVILAGHIQILLNATYKMHIWEM